MEKTRVQINQTNIKAVVAVVVADALDKSWVDIGLDDNLSRDLGADSLDMIEIVMALEDKYSITLHDLTWASMGDVTVRDISKAIWTLTAGILTVQADA
ncbi:MAG: acyl carrier protein [Patescibacteria group bacterium]